MMNRGAVLAVDSQARDETGLDRALSTHRLLSMSLALGALAGFLYWAQETVPEIAGLWKWIAAAATTLFFLSWAIDPLLAVWSRWTVVAADAGLRRSRGGVPARWTVFPAGFRSVGLIVSPDTFSAQEWEEAAPALAQGFGYDRAKVKHSRRRVALTFTNGLAPTDKPYTAPLDLQKQAVHMGIDENGKAFYLDTAGHSGCIVAGIPGSGKTVALRRLVQSFALDSANEVWVFDGKGTQDFHDLTRENVHVFSGSPDTSTAIVEELERLSLQLQERAANGDVPGRVVVVVDECQGYIPVKGLTSEEKEAREKALKVLKDLVARGRSLGFLTVLATQKPDASTLPTVLRDNCGLRACGRLRTSEGEKMVLGESPGIAQALTVGQMIVDDSRSRALVKIGRQP